MYRQHYIMLMHREERASKSRRKVVKIQSSVLLRESKSIRRISRVSVAKDSYCSSCIFSVLLPFFFCLLLFVFLASLSRIFFLFFFSLSQLWITMTIVVLRCIFTVSLYTRDNRQANLVFTIRFPRSTQYNIDSLLIIQSIQLNNS